MALGVGPYVRSAEVMEELARVAQWTVLGSDTNMLRELKAIGRAAMAMPQE